MKKASFLVAFTILHAVATVYFFLATVSFGLGMTEVITQPTAQELFTRQFNQVIFYVLGSPLIPPVLMWGSRWFDGKVFWFLPIVNSALWAYCILLVCHKLKHKRSL